ncbi:MAG: hypothetical protein H6733_10855 [Alphaproteobacteria bacterium]|nr:hypothetical protein [Alphaproteobacteria bacterium]
MRALPLLLVPLLACAPEDGTSATDATVDDTDRVDATDTPVDDTDGPRAHSDSDVADTDDTDDTDDGLPAYPGPADYDPNHTITVHLHGFILGLEPDTGPYGYRTGGGPIADGLRRYADLPSYTDGLDGPDHVEGTHYYGIEPPDTFTADEIARVEALQGVPRYAEIIAIQARHALDDAPDATGINLTCHSMGCLVSRYLIEHDVEGLVSDGAIKRWVTYAGVVSGAGLATQFGWSTSYLSALGIDPIDIEHMGYPWVEANVAWNGMRRQADNTAFHGILVHHVLADDPLLDADFAALPLLDLSNPAERANDGIMWTDDEAFLSVSPRARFVTDEGQDVLPTATFVHVDHFAAREHVGAHLVGAAALVGTRRFEVVVSSLDVGDVGETDSEIAFETTVRWPDADQRFGVDAVIDERTIAHRVAPVVPVHGTSAQPGLVLHSAMVFDEDTAVELALTVREVDRYPFVGIREGGPNDVLGTDVLTLPIEDGTVDVTLGAVTVHLATRVLTVP